LSNPRLSSFDVDLPIDCDDEYWEDPDPEKALKQPPSKPSKLTCFILFLKLCQILGFALRTLVGISRSSASNIIHLVTVFD
jgi:hypothetical protein